jgi:hypothetical protein
MVEVYGLGLKTHGVFSAHSLLYTVARLLKSMTPVGASIPTFPIPVVSIICPLGERVGLQEIIQFLGEPQRFNLKGPRRPSTGNPSPFMGSLR